jgi:hypothetical protein
MTIACIINILTPFNYITFPNIFNDFKEAQFGQGLILQTLIQKFKTFEIFELSKWELNLEIIGMTPFDYIVPFHSI